MRSRWARNVEVAAPGQFSPRFVRFVLAVLVPLVRLLHRPTLTGLEHLPRSGPFILVANHSGGLGSAEIFTLLALYLRDVGPRPLAGFAHPVGFYVWPLTVLWRVLGTIPSTYEAAARTLGLGVPILIFPGGDHETTRPLWHANRVDFGGRTGFMRIAKHANVPIIPLGIRGGHFTAPILFRWPALATLLVFPRLLGLRRWAISLLGVIGAVAIAVFVPGAWYVRAALVWLWLGTPFVFMAWIPWTLRFRIGPALPPSELPTDLAAAATLVEARVQALVEDAADERLGSCARRRA